jgi:hypothetical protein
MAYLWQTKEHAEFPPAAGSYHGLMPTEQRRCGLKGITFSNGAIEFDVNAIGPGAPGIAFRQQDEGNFELYTLCLIRAVRPSGHVATRALTL